MAAGVVGRRLGSVGVWDVPLWRASAAALAPYGTVFTDVSAARTTVERWPQPGWRPVEDGISGGEGRTQGDFTLHWDGGAHYASNSGVADGDYCFAWTSPSKALGSDKARDGDEATQPAYVVEGAADAEAQADSVEGSESEGSAFLFTEINYHACGSQLFYTADHPVLLLLAKVESRGRHHDDVEPNDFVAFYVPPGIGVDVNANVWHSPPIAAEPTRATADNRVVMFTQQAAVHTKIYYDPLAEHNTLLRVPMRTEDSVEEIPIP